ncbi:MAG: methyltransferase domain-containing protein [Caldilineaceae bacterium]|nr:methyltransferase domain-containing protein [Caldilineaceae bacterium]
MLDELAQFNKARWEAIAAAQSIYARPWLDLDDATARQRVDPYGYFGDVTGQRVLCLGSGGGQQSVAFALLGAQSTVLDLTDNQLAGDRLAADHYGLTIRIEQGDMRDLTRFAEGEFDLVYHTYSINFIPDPTTVFAQVARVLQPGGSYFVQWHNPFTQLVDETTWDGTGYCLRGLYGDQEIPAQIFAEENWTFADSAGNMQSVASPRSFRHTLSTMINGLVQHGFHVIGCREETTDETNPEPGSWEHYKAVTAWILHLWTVKATRPTKSPAIPSHV